MNSKWHHLLSPWQTPSLTEGLFFEPGHPGHLGPQKGRKLLHRLLGTGKRRFVAVFYVFMLIFHVLD